MRSFVLSQVTSTNRILSVNELNLFCVVYALNRLLGARKVYGVPIYGSIRIEFTITAQRTQYDC